MVDIYVIGAKAVSQRAINSGVMNFCFVMNIWAEAAFAILAQCSYIMLFHVVVLQQQREEKRKKWRRRRVVVGVQQLVTKQWTKTVTVNCLRNMFFILFVLESHIRLGGGRVLLVISGCSG